MAVIKNTLEFPRRFMTGFFSFGKGAQYIINMRLLRFVVLPAFLSLMTGIVLMGLLFILLVFSLDHATQSIMGMEWWGDSTGTSPSSNGITGYWSIIVKILAAFMAFILSIMLYRIIVTVSVNPFLGPLLEQVEMRELGHRLPTSVQLDTVNIMRGLWNSIKLSLLGLVVLLVGLCLGPLELPVNVLYQSYAIGRGSFDIVVEKHAPRLRDRKIYYKNWRPEIWGHGLAYFLVLLVPVFGVLVAPVCSCAGLAALFFKQQRAPVARKMK